MGVVPYIQCCTSNTMSYGCANPLGFTPAFGWDLPETLSRLASEGNREIVAEVIEAFESDTARRLRLLDDAIAHGNWAAARAQAHSIKGAASEVGAYTLVAICRRMELTADTGAGPIFAELRNEAHADFTRVCRLMNESGWAAAQ